MRCERCSRRMMSVYGQSPWLSQRTPRVHSQNDEPERLAQPDGYRLGRGQSAEDVLAIQVELLRSEVPVHGLAHITGGGMLNLLRIGSGVGYEIDCPLPVPSVFKLIAELGVVAAAEMWEVFNMGCGLCAMVPEERADDAVSLLAQRHAGAARIGQLTDRAGVMAIPGLGLVGDGGGLRAGY